MSGNKRLIRNTLTLRVGSLLLAAGIWCWCITAWGATPDSVRITGNAPDYAGMTLIIETVSHPLLREQEELTRLTINEDGNYSGAFAIDETTQCTIDLGHYRGAFYAQPGQHYQLALPPYKPRPEAERFNPFFEPEIILLGVLTPDAQDFNERINDYEIDFEAHYNAYAMTLFNQHNSPLAKRVCEQLDSIHPSGSDSFFIAHKHFRASRLYALAMRRLKRQHINRFFSNEPVRYRMPAYWDSFNETFKDFFAYYFQSPSGKRFRMAFNEGAPYDSLSLIMKNDTLFTRDDLRETVMIRALYDAYYTGIYDEKRINDLLTQMTERAQCHQTRHLARRIIDRINRLKTGTIAPPLEALNTNGKIISLADFRGKFVYLNFMHTQNYACKKQLQALAAIARELKRDLVVLTVLADENDQPAFDYMLKNNFKWEVLHFGGNGRILSDYNIKAMPMYYLIDPDGNLALSPAPAPEENFAERFIEVQRNYKNNKTRMTPDKQRSIFDM
ncbi:peroxiredoxin [Breznakibacter xylanolyticus]|uniref:Peroxiredoxin n=1 Tax=Breznakibacter xylanolyticus TaxID=990 RepID=A0A2W7NCT0_9BACT|nr:TlpA disulfide reductase family protein [Breznakibacter xylanolyticus]PZX17433.1 peroxiredoxin [Breznakibacter xylanolyticus]